mgnify:CR=1 FL=1
MDARVKPFEEKMQKAYDFLLGDYQTIRAGRANPHVLDKVKGYNIKYPIVIDSEKNPCGDRTMGLSNSKRSEILKAFCEWEA